MTGKLVIFVQWDICKHLVKHWFISKFMMSITNNYWISVTDLQPPGFHQRSPKAWSMSTLPNLWNLTVSKPTWCGSIASLQNCTSYLQRMRKLFWEISKIWLGKQTNRLCTWPGKYSQLFCKVDQFGGWHFKYYPVFCSDSENNRPKQWSKWQKTLQ